MILVRNLVVIAILFNALHAKEVFTEENIMMYLNLNNPFIYSAVGDKYIYKERENYQHGNFDTKLSAKYDKKDYPLSDAEYISAGVSKPIENGMEFSLDYRRSEGTQEYSNIKTGDDGELLLGVKIPVLSVMNNINKRKLDLDSARLDTRKVEFITEDNLRLLYFKIVSSYYKLLHHKQSNTLVLELLNNAKKRVSIIKKRVDAGSLPELSFLEAQQQIINRQQRLLNTQNRYKNALETFLQYLNISPEVFDEKYSLPSLSQVQSHYKEKEVSIDKALENRPDIKAFSTEIKKLTLENKFTSISQYPDVDVGVYGVHDFEYENGFKITLGMNFPLERRKYTSKSLEIKKSIQNIQKKREQKTLKIKRDLKVLHNSINTLVKNIDNSTREVSLVERLEQAEVKKYKVGLSNLFMVNQREIYTLQIKKKLLQYTLDYLLLEQELDKVSGTGMKTLPQ